MVTCVAPPPVNLEEEKAYRSAALKKWEEYLNTTNFGQEQLSA